MSDLKTREQVLQAIYGAIEMINEELAPERSLARAPDTALVGPAAVLDSLQFVRLTVATEDNIERSLGVRTSVMDAVDLDAGEMTVSALAECISENLEVLPS